MHKWPIMLIAGGAMWFAADLICAMQPQRATEVWTSAFIIASVAGAIAGMRGKRVKPALIWLLRYLASFVICAVLGASLWLLGDIGSATAMDVASAATIASLFLTSALWTSLLRVEFAISGGGAWAASVAAYVWLPDQVHLVMAVAGGALLALPGVALYRMMPRPPRRAR